MAGLFVLRERERAIIIHQSDLSAWSRCAAQYGYKRAGLPRKTTSAIAYGNVMHHALHVLEDQVANGTDLLTALDVAIETFTTYWDPRNIEAISEPVPEDGWIRGQGYTQLRMKGVASLRTYADLMRFDQMEVLGLEYSFMCPIENTWDDKLGEPHILAGTVDRLAVRFHRQVETLCVDDYKTGKAQYHLQHNLQFSAYLWATTKPEFWTGWRGEDGFGPDRGQKLFERFADTPRRAFWVNLKDLKVQDAGFRDEIHYRRFILAVNQVTASIEADIFPLTISGDACTYCFAGETEVWTDRGVRRIDSLAGTQPKLLVNRQGGGKWVKAPVRSFGIAPVTTVTLARGRQVSVIRATPNHRWHVLERSDPSRTQARVVETRDLKPGDRLLSVKPASRLGKIQPSHVGIAAGIVFGDGSAHRDTSRITLWGESCELERFFPGVEKLPRSRDGLDGLDLNGLPHFMKCAPDLNESASYLYGWLVGYFAADGHINARGQAQLSSASRVSLELARTVACRLGIFTHEINGYERLGIDGKMSTLWKFTLPLDQLGPEFFVQERHLRYWRDGVPSNRIFTVTSVKDLGEEEEVFCATVPEDHNFTLAGFINVGNCEYRDICGGLPVPSEDFDPTLERLGV